MEPRGGADRRPARPAWTCSGRTAVHSETGRGVSGARRRRRDRPAPVSASSVSPRSPPSPWSRAGSRPARAVAAPKTQRLPMTGLVETSAWKRLFRSSPPRAGRDARRRGVISQSSEEIPGETERRNGNRHPCPSSPGAPVGRQRPRRRPEGGCPRDRRGGPGGRRRRREGSRFGIQSPGLCRDEPSRAGFGRCRSGSGRREGLGRPWRPRGPGGARRDRGGERASGRIPRDGRPDHRARGRDPE